MKERIKQLAEQVGAVQNVLAMGRHDGVLFTETELERFAELIVAEAFRAGILYSAKKYVAVGDDRFTGNDVSMFLEMEADELSDDEIKQHFEVTE